MRVFRGAMIGCGFFSRHHVEEWRRMPNVEIVAACDNRQERAQAVSACAYVSPQAMLGREDYSVWVTRRPPPSDRSLCQVLRPDTVLSRSKSHPAVPCHAHLFRDLLWQDYAHRGKQKAMTISAHEFLRCFLSSERETNMTDRR